MSEEDGSHSTGENIASRLEGLANIGGICVSEQVFQQARNVVDAGFEHMGRQELKNVAEAVPVYRVLLDPANAGVLVYDRGSSDSGRKWKPWAAAALLVASLVAGLLWAALRDGT